MEWYPLDTWTIVIGVLCAAACALPGTMLVLRKMSMMGDAISHTVLPGLAIAFLVTNSRDPLPMFIGAAVIGVITAFLVEWVKTLGRTDGGTSMGVVFTALFALGLVLIRRALDEVDLDPGCVLYGDVLTAATDMVTFLGFEVPRAVLINGGMLLVNGLIIGAMYKEFKISSFDPALATTQGINAKFMHYLLMTMTAATTVAAFETVGSILVIAMLIVPPATAYLLTDRFGRMLLLSMGIGAVAAALGHVSAITVPRLFGFDDTITSGMMAFMTGVLFVVVWMLSPRHGMVSKVWQRTRLTVQILREDVLGMLYRLEELVGRRCAALAPAQMWEGLRVNPAIGWLAAQQLKRAGKVARDHDGYYLTDDGRGDARRLIRAHRLWESYLHHHLGLAPDHVHPTAHVLEHITDSEMRRRLEARVESPSTDPHGKEIPEENGQHREE